MDNFNFNLFKYFYYVVLYNGVTNASKNLSVAQPSLSLSIKKLESELNVTLIDRSSYQFKLTEQGQKLFEVLKPAFDTISESINFKNDENKFLELNIGINQSYGKVILSEVLKKFRKKYPKVKINIDLYQEVDKDKAKGEYDIVIDNILYLKEIEDVNPLVLAKIPNYFVCGNTLYDEYGEIRDIKELNILPLVSYKPSLKTGKFRELCYKYNVKFIEIASVNESDLYFSLLKENIGIGFSNKLLLKEYIDEKDLFILDLDVDTFDDEIALVDFKNNTFTKELIEILKKYVVEELK